MRDSQRDAVWFDRTYRTHEHAVRSYAYRRVGPDHADDIVAETFTTLWRHRDNAPERTLNWLYGVAANHISHLARTQARGDRLTQKISALDPGATSYLNEDAAEARALLDSLVEDDAELLRLAYWEELSPADIAQVLGISAGAARVRLHRARKRAAAQLDSEITPHSLLADPKPSNPAKPLDHTEEARR